MGQNNPFRFSIIAVSFIFCQSLKVVPQLITCYYGHKHFLGEEFQKRLLSNFTLSSASSTQSYRAELVKTFLSKSFLSCALS